MNTQAQPLPVGKKAPAFQSVTFTGDKIKLSDFLGEYTAVYFYPKTIRQVAQIKPATCKII